MQTRLLAILAVLILVWTGCVSDPEPTSESETTDAAAQASSAAEPMSDGLLPLPEFTDCASTEHPELPPKWRANALLQDFVQPLLTFGQFVYDESVGAFRFQLATQYGASVDLLVTTDRTLYRLYGGETPTSCSLVTNDSPLTVPPRDWLDSQAVCVGEAPILERDQAWWKTPSGEGANWVWYGTDSGLPFRTMYYEDVEITDPVPVYEHFTFNYFPVFEPVESTNLGQLLEMCAQAGDTATALEGFDIHKPDSIAAAPAGAPLTSDSDHVELVQSWIPGLSECNPEIPLPPPWPDQVQGTVFMTAVSFPPNPFPTRVFYDWTRKAQNTSLYYYEPENPEDYVQVALLTGDTGNIRIENEQGRISMCQQALPGPQVPNWKNVDGCACRATLAPGSVLNPSGEETQILWCPTDLSASQVFWTWYSNSGTPVVFMQTNSSPTAGTGLNLADYYHWEPGSEAPAGTFDLPAACEGEPKEPVPAACHNCHLPFNE